jgi:hypothetical protein
MSLTIRELKVILSELPDTMRVVCTYPCKEPDYDEDTEVTAVNSYHIESFENEQGHQEVALVLSVFETSDSPDPESMRDTLQDPDNVPPPIVLGED